MKYMNAVKVTTILVKVGKVEEIEESIVEGRILRTFVRAKMELDITKPQPSGCWIPRKDLPKIWVVYKHERLHDLCFNCGVIGHEQKGCKIPRVMSAYCASIPKYDESLSTTPPRPIALIQKEHIKRYGNTTVDTAKKFYKTNKEGEASTKPKVHCMQTTEKEMVKQKA